METPFVFCSADGGGLVEVFGGSASGSVVSGRMKVRTALRKCK